MSLSNQFHKTCRDVWFSYSQFLNFFAFSLIVGFYWFCVYLEAYSLCVDFSLVFHYNASKPEASNQCRFFFGLCLLYTVASNTNIMLLECAISWIWLWEEYWPCEHDAWCVCTVVFNTWSWFCEAVSMGTKSWNCSQHVVKLVKHSSQINCLYNELGLWFQWNC
jgi:hypothetical protein